MEQLKLYPLNSITAKQERVRNKKLFNYLLGRQLYLINNFTKTKHYLPFALRTNNNLILSLLTYCNLTPSEYDYMNSLKYQKQWGDI